MRFLPKSRSHDSDGSVASETCSGSVSGASSGTARARIARYGARHAHSSPTHHDHASDEPPTHEWPDVSDNDDCDEDNDDDDLHHVDGQPGQSSRTLLLSDGADLKDTRV